MTALQDLPLDQSLGTPAPRAPGSPAGPAAITRQAWLVLAVAAAGVFVVFLDATVVNIAFPALSADFPTVSRAGLSWVLNGYAVVVGALLVTAGRLADSRGRRKVFLSGVLLFAFASALCGLAPTIPALVAARVLQGVGAALLVPASLALILPEFPVAKRATAVGIWGAVGALAAATGPSIGALLVEGPGWRWVFLVNVPFCVLALVAGRIVLRESTGTGREARPDVLGVVLVTAVFGLLSLGIVQGESWGWGSVRTVGALVLATALTPLLVVRAVRHPSPALPVRLFAVRSFSVASLGTLLFAAAFFANLLCNVLFLTGVWHWSILRTAAAVLPGPLLAALVSPPAGRLADRFGHRVVIVPGALAFGAGQLVYAFSLTTTPSYAHLLPGLLLVGLGIGLAFPTLGSAGAASLPSTQFGSGSAVVSAARQLGAVLGVAVLVAVLGNPGPADAMAAFQRSWLAIAGAALACAGVVAVGLARPARSAALVGARRRRL